VHQQQVDPIAAERAQARFDRAREIGGAQMLVRYFRGDEDLFARDAGRADSFATPRSLPYFRAVSIWR
jgi:hypothetical protein